MDPNVAIENALSTTAAMDVGFQFTELEAHLMRRALRASQACSGCGIPACRSCQSPLWFAARSRVVDISA